MPPSIRALRPGLRGNLHLQLRQLATSAPRASRPSRPSRAAPPPPPTPPPPAARKLPRSVKAALVSFTLFVGSVGGMMAYRMREDDKFLNPWKYTQHAVGNNVLLTPQHTLLTVPLVAEEQDQFNNLPNLVTVHHVMLGAPQIQIERPYTPINDVRDDHVEVVVKRVPGGEVGRLVHSLKKGDELAMRGPLQTFSLDQSQYDTVVMVSGASRALRDGSGADMGRSRRAQPSRRSSSCSARPTLRARRQSSGSSMPCLIPAKRTGRRASLSRCRPSGVTGSTSSVSPLARLPRGMSRPR